MSTFPKNPAIFTSIASAGKTRIFLLRHEGCFARLPELEQVATLSADTVLGERLVRALNDAAWTGQTSLLDAMDALIPDAVMHGVLAALERCPDPEDLALGLDSAPMTVLKELSFARDSEDLAIAANAAMELGFQFIFENQLNDRGEVVLEARVLSDEAECVAEQVDRWWPTWVPVAERLQPDPDQFVELLSDPRWDRRMGRGFWLWIEDDDGEDSHTAQWVIEFLDADLEPERNFNVFITGAHYDDGYLTERTRFLLWLTLRAMSADLDSLCGEWDTWESSVREDMPALVQHQPRAWWLSLYRSTDRLCEAARRGDVDRLVPLTPGEEAVIYLATTRGYADSARDWIELFGLESDFAALPVHEDDETWEEVLGDLTGDVDVELMWAPDAGGRADPNNPSNRALGMGDYRPDAWHRLFERAIPHTLPETGLDWSE